MSRPIYHTIAAIASPGDAMIAFDTALDEFVGVHVAVAAAMHGKDPVDRLQFEHFERDVWSMASSRHCQARALELVGGSCPTPDDDPTLAFSALCQLPACGFGDMPVGKIMLAALPMVCAMLAEHFRRAVDEEGPGHAK